MGKRQCTAETGQRQQGKETGLERLPGAAGRALTSPQQRQWWRERPPKLEKIVPQLALRSSTNLSFSSRHAPNAIPIWRRCGRSEPDLQELMSWWGPLTNLDAHRPPPSGAWSHGPRLHRPFASGLCRSFVFVLFSVKFSHCWREGFRMQVAPHLTYCPQPVRGVHGLLCPCMWHSCAPRQPHAHVVRGDSAPAGRRSTTAPAGRQLGRGSSTKIT